jgi:hypothetical protein
MVDVTNPDRYWDMVAVFEKVTNVYCDFEGFSGPDDILRIVAWADDIIEDNPLLRDLMIHYVHECVEQAEAPSREVVIEVAAAFQMLLAARYVMKSTAEDEGDPEGKYIQMYPTDDEE